MQKTLTTKDAEINRKIFIIQARTYQVKLARKLKVTRQALNNELRGVYRSEKIRLGICKIIKVPKEIFWPEFYGSTQSNVVPEKGAQDVCVEAI